MYTFQCNSETIIKANNLLSKKIGVCDVLPEVRLTTLQVGKQTSVTLVCKHSDPSLNCGTSAEYCERCLDKEKHKMKSNTAFKEMLSNTNIMKALNEALGDQTK